MKPNPKPLPFAVYYTAVLTLAMAGVADSIYLFYSHYRNYTDIAYSSFCAISKAINCDTVSQSPYSIFLDLPIPVWGILGYLVLVFLIAASTRNPNGRADLWSLIFLVGIAFSLSSVVLALVSTYLVQSYCIMCIVSYGINLMITFLAWIVLRRFDSRPFAQRVIGDLLVIQRRAQLFVTAGLVTVALVVGTGWGLPAYWKLASTQGPGELMTGTTDDGAPWIGAEHPELTIVEFSDYMCFQCRKMHIYLRQLVARHPDRIRLVHRHFPMDHNYNPMVGEPFHTGSGKMAVLAIYAQAKGQFWKVNDVLFDLAGEKKDFNSRTIALSMGVDKSDVVAALDNRRLRLWLKHEIAVGIDLGITGTPTYLIDGNLYPGNIPADILKRFITAHDG